MTFGLPQPRMAGSKFFPRAGAKKLGPIEAAIVRDRFRSPPAKTVRRIEAALSGEPKTTEHPTMRKIADEVCSREGISFDLVRSDCRHAWLAVIRQEIMWRCRMETFRSYPAIGKFLSRDHTSVIHGIRKHEERLAKARGEA